MRSLHRHRPQNAAARVFTPTALTSAMLLAMAMPAQADDAAAISPAPSPVSVTTPAPAAATPAVELATVTVTADSKADGLETVASNGALGSAKVLDTPFSIRSVTADDISERQVNSLETLFLRDASVTALSGTYSNWGATMTVRGLPLDYSNSYKLNGMALNNFSGELPYEIFERVDLLKGATGFMYGFSATGGIVNYVSKKPTEAFLFSADVGYRSDNILSEHVDVGGRVGTEKQFGYRLNVGHEAGDTVNEGGSLQRDTIALSLDARLSQNLVWTADLIKNDRNVDSSISWLYNDMAVGSALPTPVKGERNPAIPGTYEDDQNLIAQTGITWQFADGWSGSLSYGHAENNTRWIKNLVQLQNTAGDLITGLYDQVFDVTFDQAMAVVQGQFETGSLKHQLVAGVDWSHSESSRGVTNGSERRVVWTYNTDNLYNPNTNIPYYPGPLAPFTPKNLDFDDTTQQAIFISDTIALNEQWSVLGGLRFNDYEYASRYDKWVPYQENAVTPTLAVMFKPMADTTLYASYVEALEKGGTTDVANGYAQDQVLPPLISRQYEIGAKTERSHWASSAALFRIDRGAEYDIGTAPSKVRVQDGITRYDGMEVAGVVRPLPSLDVDASLMLLQATYEDVAPTSTIAGNDVQATPNVQATLGANYRINAVPGLAVNAGAKYTGDMPLEQDNNWELPAYTLFDAGVSYSTRIGEHGLTLRGTVTNLANKAYWATNGDSNLRIGEPRTIALNAKFDW